MKFFHLSDLHIGKQLHRYNMSQDQSLILEQIVEKAAEYRPDAIIIAGDIYDKSVPSGEACLLFDEFLNRLASLTPMIPVLIIAGNHDSADRLQYATGFLEKHQIYIAVRPPQRPEETLRKITLQDAFGEVDFYLFPFTKPGYVRQLFEEDEVTDYDSAFRKVLEREQIDFSYRRNVLVAHQFFMTNGKSPEVCDSEQLSLNIGGLDAIDAGAVEGFDYVALGHLHAPQTLAGGKIRYCGTPLKYSVSEEKHEKSITLVTLGEKGELPQLQMIPLQPLRDVRRLKGTLARLLQMPREEAAANHDYVSITLTDDKEPYRPKDALEEIYDHILEITVDNARTRAILAQHEGSEERLLSPLEAFAEFYQMMQQQPMSREEAELAAQILAEL